MNKRDFLQAFKDSAGLATLRDADALLSHLAVVIYNALAADMEVTLPNVGKFSTKFRQERNGRNPATGESIRIPASIRPVFRPAKEFRKFVANK